MNVVTNHHDEIRHTHYKNRCKQTGTPLRDGDGVNVAVICRGITLRDVRNWKGELLAAFKPQVTEIWEFDQSKEEFARKYKQGDTYDGKDPDNNGTFAAELIAGRRLGLADKARLFVYVVSDFRDDTLILALQAVLANPNLHVVNLALVTPAVEMNDDPILGPKFEGPISEMQKAGRVVVMAAGSTDVPLDRRSLYCGLPARLVRGLTAGSAERDSTGLNATRTLYYDYTGPAGYFRPNIYAPGDMPRSYRDHQAENTVIAGALAAGTATLGVQQLGRGLANAPRIISAIVSAGSVVNRTGATSAVVRFLDVEAIMTTL